MNSVFYGSLKCLYIKNEFGYCQHCGKAYEKHKPTESYRFIGKRKDFSENKENQRNTGSIGKGVVQKAFYVIHKIQVLRLYASILS